MSDRYENRRQVINDLERYKALFQKRGVNFINMYKTPVLKHLTEEEIAELTVLSHRWTSRDTFYKMAHQYYGDPTMWWVIAWFNQKPTDSHPILGEIIYVPTPLDEILSLYGV